MPRHRTHYPPQTHLHPHPRRIIHCAICLKPVANGPTCIGCRTKEWWSGLTAEQQAEWRARSARLSLQVRRQRTHRRTR